MHCQGSRRRSPVAHTGDVVHETGCPEHDAEVIDATETTVTVQFFSDGAVVELGRGEFGELFEVA